MFGKGRGKWSEFMENTEINSSCTLKAWFSVNCIKKRLSKQYWPRLSEYKHTSHFRDSYLTIFKKVQVVLIILQIPTCCSLFDSCFVWMLVCVAPSREGNVREGAASWSAARNPEESGQEFTRVHTHRWRRWGSPFFTTDCVLVLADYQCC